MVSQVKVVGILMIVNGCLLGVFGLLFAVLGQMFPLLMSLEERGPKRREDEVAMTVVSVIYFLFGAVMLVVGVLHIFAGTRLMKFRGRVFALVVLFLNILPILSCYCALPALGMMIYGLIVLFNSQTAQGFDLVRRGMSVKAMLRHFTPRLAYEEGEPPDEDELA